MRRTAALFLLALLIAACAPPAPAGTPPLEQAMTAAIGTLNAAMTATAAAPPVLPTATPTPVPTPTAPRTPPALPGPYVSPLLNPRDTPHTYIADTCQYLKLRWDPNNAAPGTVVMVIMFHSITDGQVTAYNQMSVGEFKLLMNDLKSQGFEAIDTAQLADFLERNAKIPPRSVLLIQDDRKFRANFDTHFYPYYQAYGWKVVNAWISAADTSEALWADNIALENEGWVDHQAHGVVHNIPIETNSSDAYILGELQGSIDAFRQRFNKTPIAFIWPGGGFTPRSVELARQVGYRLGFTVNPRGPLMFNWIPQMDAFDPARPSYLPEGPAGDPLLTLPRYWSPDARMHIDEVRLIGKEAAAYAEANRAIELAYYDIVCAPTYGPIPDRR